MNLLASWQKTAFKSKNSAVDGGEKFEKMTRAECSSLALRVESTFAALRMLVSSIRYLTTYNAAPTTAQCAKSHNFVQKKKFVRVVCEPNDLYLVCFGGFLKKHTPPIFQPI